MLMPPPELHTLLGLDNDFFDLIVDTLKEKDPKFLEIVKRFLKRYNLLTLFYMGFWKYVKTWGGQKDPPLLKARKIIQTR